MNLAILSPPGCVDKVLQPGVTANVVLLGALATTIPEPPGPPSAPGVT